MSPILYATLCVLVPICWGVLVVWVTGLIERRITLKRTGDEMTPVAHDDRV